MREREKRTKENKRVKKVEKPRDPPAQTEGMEQQGELLYSHKRKYVKSAAVSREICCIPVHKDVQVHASRRSRNARTHTHADRSVRTRVFATGGYLQKLSCYNTTLEIKNYSVRPQGVLKRITLYLLAQKEPVIISKEKRRKEKKRKRRRNKKIQKKNIAK